LRKDSYNTTAILALKSLAPITVEIEVGDIGTLPLFNPDREGEAIPALEKLKFQVHKVSGFIIASPEYAHGISGPMKNALDWLVSGEEFPFMPIMLINTSPRASHAINALKEVLGTMAGDIVEESCVSIPLLGSQMDAEAVSADEQMAAELLTGLGHLVDRIKKPKNR